MRPYNVGVLEVPNLEPSSTTIVFLSSSKLGGRTSISSSGFNIVSPSG
jgi:hypothetical protein